MGRSRHSERLPARAPEVARAGVYTARPDWTYAAESAWSRVAKFQWLNRLAALELHAALGAYAIALGSDGIDLRCAQGFDLGAMAATLQVSEAHLQQSFCVPRRAEALLDRCARSLRFCGSCIRDAYHATVFQFRFVHRCPVHREILQRTCPHCEAPIAYRLDHALVQQPYGCASCKRPLYARKALHVRAVQSAIPGAHVELIRDWQRYIAVATELYTGAPRERPRGSRGHYVSFAVDAPAKALGSRFAFLRDLQDAYTRPPPLPPALAASLRARALTSLPAGYDERASLAHPFEQRWPHLQDDYGWYARVYSNAVRRFGCRLPPIDTSRMRLKRRSRTLVLAEHHQPEAVALLGWRLAWEGTARLQAKRRRLPLLGLLEWWAFAPLRPSGVPLALWRIALRRWFKEDLQRLFEHWTALALWMQPRRVYLVNRHFLSPGILWLDPDEPMRWVQVPDLSTEYESHD